MSSSVSAPLQRNSRPPHVTEMAAATGLPSDELWELWEGLTDYLPDEAERLLCEPGHQLSAAGSAWAVESLADPCGAVATLTNDYGPATAGRTDGNRRRGHRRTAGAHEHGAACHGSAASAVQ